MRVLITSPVFPPDLGGPAVYVPSLARWLVERGHEVKVVAQGRLQFKGGAMTVAVSPPPASIQRVLIILHGRLRNADTYLHSAEKAAGQAGQQGTTLIIAPQFLNEQDVTRHTLPNELLRWRGNDWMAGGLSTGPNPVSSFQVLDDIVARVSDRQQFPEVKERLLQHGAFAESTTPDEAARRIRSEIAMWAKVITDAGITPD